MYGLDEGGYFGVFGWSIEALTGALAYDVVQWSTNTETLPNAKLTPTTAESMITSDNPVFATPRGSRRDAGELDAPLLARGRVGQQRDDVMQRTDNVNPLARVTTYLVGGGITMMTIAYLLSCLGAPRYNLNPLCYNGTQGEALDCFKYVLLASSRQKRAHC